jgi:hypothetical protein
MTLRQQQPVVSGMHRQPPFTGGCSKLASDHSSILVGSTKRRHRSPELQTITLSHSRTLSDRHG